jgi:hypothetical protein
MSSIPASSNPMCALLIVMVIIIVVSGIIVFGVIITVKYYNEEDVDKIMTITVTDWTGSCKSFLTDFLVLQW